MNGYIDKTGRFIIQPQPYPFTLGRFSDGLAQVEIKSGGKTLWGYANKTGRTVIPAKFDYAGIFSEGLARVKIGTKWGYINKTGDIAIKLTFDQAGNFSNGLVPVVAGGQLSFINRNGQIQFNVPDATPSDLEIIGIEFSEGLAPVKIGDRYGYINLDGRFAIQPKFTFAGRFSEGLANVMVATQEGLLHGYIDDSGTFIIAPQFASAMPFYDGLARVRVGDAIYGRMGYINRTRYIWKPSD